MKKSEDKHFDFKLLKSERRLSKELLKYGYVFSVRNSIVTYLMVVFFTVALGLFFKLQSSYHIILVLWAGGLLPFFVRNSYKNRYEEERFSDINIYIEQFLYSFMKSGNILTTLEDVRKLFPDGKMAEAIDDAMAHITECYEGSEIEKEALAMIEEKYPADIVDTMHGFALQVEKNGGEYSSSIMLLLETRRAWASGVYELLREKKVRRFNILLSIITSLGLCSLMYLITKDMGISITDNSMSQVVTLLVLMVDFGIFYLADRKLAMDFISREEVDPQEYLDMMDRIESYDEKFFMQRMGKKTAIRNVTRQLEKEFPKWLMEVALLLQSENVQVAIFKSYEGAPVIMKPKLKIFIEELQVNPTGVEPYLNFLSEFTLPSCSSAMKMLYSISEGTGGDASEQITEIIRQNKIMMDKAQQMKNEDLLAGMYALFLAPQLTGGCKLMVDMMVLVFAYIGQMGGGAWNR